MSFDLSEKESPQAIEIQRSFGPPLLPQEPIFRMPPSTQARVVSYNILVTSPINGVLFNTISLHEPGGAIVINTSCLPILNTSFAIFGAGVTRAIAGPEQARVPFFSPNILIGTIPKDLYALPGYEFRLNSIAGLAQRQALVTIFLSTGNE